MSDFATQRTDWQRLAVLPGIFSGQVFINFLVLGLVSIPLTGGFPSPYIIILLIFTACLGALSRFATTRFKFDETQFIVVRGILRKDETVIPFSQLHDIDLVQNPIHKATKSAKLQLQTSSGTGATIELDGVKLTLVEEVRTLLTAFQEDHSNEIDVPSVEATHSEPEKAVARMKWLDSVKLGTIRNPLLAFIAASFAFLANFLDDLVRLFDWEAAYLDQEILAVTFSDGLIPWPDVAILDPSLFVYVGGLAIALLCAGIFVLVFAAVLISLVMYHRFQLVIQDETIRVTSGMFFSVNKKTPLQRIQLLRSVSTLRHRLYRAASIYYDSSAANVSTKNSPFEGVFGEWLVPFLPDGKVPETMSIFMPNIDFRNNTWHRIELRAWKRRFKKNLVYVLPLVVIASITTLWLGLLAILYFAWDALESRRYVDRLRYALGSKGFLVRKGWWVRTFTVVPYEKIQSVSLKRTVFDRFARMATLRIDVAAHESRRYACEVPYLETQQALDLADTLTQEASRRKFEW